MAQDEALHAAAGAYIAATERVTEAIKPFVVDNPPTLTPERVAGIAELMTEQAAAQAAFHEAFSGYPSGRQAIDDQLDASLDDAAGESDAEQGS